MKKTIIICIGTLKDGLERTQSRPLPKLWHFVMELEIINKDMNKDVVELNILPWFLSNFIYFPD